MQPDAGGAQPGESRRDHWAGGPATHLQAPDAPVGLCLGEEEMGGPEAERGESALLSAFVCVCGDCQRVFLRVCVFLETKAISIHEVRTSEPRATPSTEDEQDLRTWGQGTRPGPSGN